MTIQAKIYRAVELGANFSANSTSKALYAKVMDRITAMQAGCSELELLDIKTAFDASFALSEVRKHLEPNEENSASRQHSSILEELEDKYVRVLFGLKPEHIEVIEAELLRFKEIEPKYPNYEPKFQKYVWDSIAAKVGWCPFTLSLAYFKQLDKQNQLTNKQQ